MSPRGRIWLTCRCNGFEEIAQSFDRLRAQRLPNDRCVGGHPLWVGAGIALIKGMLVDNDDVSPGAPQEPEGLVGAAGPHNGGRCLEDRPQTIGCGFIANNQQAGTSHPSPVFRAGSIGLYNVTASQTLYGLFFSHSSCAPFVSPPDVA